jgi:hypothetical protein
MDPAILPPHLRRLPEVLEVLLVCFEAAADAILPINLAYAKRLQAVKGIDRWRLWRTQDLSDPPADALSLPFPPPEMITALARLNMCDAFAFLLEENTNNLMRDFFNAEAHWLFTMPQPASTLAFATDQSPDIIPWHSVLMIELDDGGRLIMDGTPTQMGWKRETWLLPFGKYVRERLRGQGNNTNMLFFAQHKDRSVTRKALKTIDEGYWMVVEERMQDLFRELRWSELGRMTQENRVKMVRDQADRKFAGAWEEAMQKRQMKQWSIEDKLYNRIVMK